MTLEKGAAELAKAYADEASKQSKDAALGEIADAFNKPENPIEATRANGRAPTHPFRCSFGCHKIVPLPGSTCPKCGAQGPRPGHGLDSVRALQLRALAERLEARPCAASLDGYELADGLRAAADLLEGSPGPFVHEDALSADADDTFRVALRSLMPRSP